MMEKVGIKIIRSDSKSFVFDNASWGISKLTGLGCPKIQLFTEDKAVGDGSYVTGQRLSDREHGFVVTAKDKSLNATFRRQLIRYFNPMYTYDVYYTYQQEQKHIESKLLAPVIPSENIYKRITADITFLSVDPYFKSVDEYGKDIAAITGCFGWPYVSILNKGFLYGKYNFAQEVTIYNDGDTDVYGRFVIKATDEVVNPCLEQGDNKITILDTMVADDEYIIDLVNGKVTKNGINANNKIDRASDITSIIFKVGDNSISFGADDGDNNMQVVIYYNKLYLGV